MSFQEPFLHITQPIQYPAEVGLSDTPPKKNGQFQKSDDKATVVASAILGDTSAAVDSASFQFTVKVDRESAPLVVFPQGAPPVTVQGIVRGQVAQEMDDFLSAMQKNANFSGTVLVVNRGEIILSKG